MVFMPQEMRLKLAQTKSIEFWHALDVDCNNVLDLETSAAKRSAWSELATTLWWDPVFDPLCKLHNDFAPGRVLAE
jgi:hypothetical protein